MEKSDLRTVIKFWRKAFTRSWREVWQFFDVKGRILNLIIVIMLALVLWIADNKPPVIANIQEQLNWLFWVAFFFMPILSLFNVLLVVPAMYNELGGFIENPFVITARPPLNDNRPPHISRSASLTVENTSQFRIEKSFLTLDSIVNEDGEQVLISRQRILSWSSGETKSDSNNHRVNEELDIVPKVERVIDLAKTHRDEMVITVWRGQQPLPQGTYDFHITAHGKWKGNDISKPETFVVEYKGGNTVLVSKKIANEKNK